MKFSFPGDNKIMIWLCVWFLLSFLLNLTLLIFTVLVKTLWCIYYYFFFYPNWMTVLWRQVINYKCLSNNIELFQGGNGEGGHLLPVSISTFTVLEFSDNTFNLCGIYNPNWTLIFLLILAHIGETVFFCSFFFMWLAVMTSASK